MDILIYSNLERLLFEITNHNSEKISEWMDQLVKEDCYTVDESVKKTVKNIMLRQSMMLADKNLPISLKSSCFVKSISVVNKKWKPAVIPIIV